MVTPAASARVKPGSCGHTECIAHTSAVFGSVDSFVSLVEEIEGDGETPRCECVSMIPGVTNLPLASITSVPAGTSRFRPTSMILPPRMRRSPPSISSPAAVMIVAPRMRVGPEASGR